MLGNELEAILGCGKILLRFLKILLRFLKILLRFSESRQNVDIINFGTNILSQLRTNSLLERILTHQRNLTKIFENLSKILDLDTESITNRSGIEFYMDIVLEIDFEIFVKIPRIVDAL